MVNIYHALRKPISRLHGKSRQSQIKTMELGVTIHLKNRVNFAPANYF